MPKRDGAVRRRALQAKGSDRPAKTGAKTAAKRERRARRKLRIGISCYAHFGGSGVVASRHDSVCS